MVTLWGGRLFEVCTDIMDEEGMVFTMWQEREEGEIYGKVDQEKGNEVSWPLVLSSA